MSSKPIIIWEKWRDPYGSDDTPEIQSIIEDMLNKKLADQDIESDTEEPVDETVENVGFIKHKMPMMITPIGLIPLTENTAPGKIFNFWTGHSNFNITQKISNIIEDTYGVETLDIFTRYRFRIGVGKAFKDAEVMHDINQQVYSYLE
jgi:hypothetical protein